MKFFSTKQIAEIDAYTIQHEPIADIYLMERASMQITNWLVQHFSTEQKMVFFAGPGNNGGDALAIARQLAEFDYDCSVYLLSFGKELKGSPAANWQRLEEQGKVQLNHLNTFDDFPELKESDIVVDGLFGSGLTRQLEGLSAEVVVRLNQTLNTIVAIDIPSGLMGENNDANRSGHIIRADFTLTFQFPKVSFLLAGNDVYTGKWEVLPIGLHPKGIEELLSPYVFIEKDEVQPLIPQRSTFEHKGSFGHALLIAGSYGKMGAAILASKACLRAGVGLLTSHVPHVGYPIIQTAVPEAMASIDRHELMFTEFPELSAYAAIGVGPGLGTKQNTQRALLQLLKSAKVPMVLDADALNILAENKEWLNFLPEGSVLTPHPGEFYRLVGRTDSAYQSIEKQLEFSKKYKCTVVLKGAHTSVSTAEGKLYFNSTGNPGMATAGSGDVLTGIILGLLAQGMAAEEAAVAGVFLHGYAGDLVACNNSEPALVAGDIVDYLGKAFGALE